MVFVLVLGFLVWFGFFGIRLKKWEFGCVGSIYMPVVKGMEIVLYMQFELYDIYRCTHSG